MTIERTAFGVSVIAGAAGGVGVATCRLLGRQGSLLVNDIDADRLAVTAAQLRDEGYEVEAIAGDLADPVMARRLAEATRSLASRFTLVNAAGLSPTQADWRTIAIADIVAPHQLLDAFEPLVGPGCVAVMVASIAGHLGPRDERLEQLFAEPLQPDMLALAASRLAVVLDRVPGTIEGHAYSFSKRALIRACEARAPSWGKRGARINSISPGGIWTAMGRREAEQGQRVSALIEATPAGRWGTAIDMASAIDFLASPHASYITGSDLRIDGGAVASLRGQDW